MPGARQHQATGALPQVRRPPRALGSLVWIRPREPGLIGTRAPDHPSEAEERHARSIPGTPPPGGPYGHTRRHRRGLPPVRPRRRPAGRGAARPRRGLGEVPDRPRRPADRGPDQPATLARQRLRVRRGVRGGGRDPRRGHRTPPGPRPVPGGPRPRPHRTGDRGGGRLGRDARTDRRHPVGRPGGALRHPDPRRGQRPRRPHPPARPRRRGEPAGPVLRRGLRRRLRARAADGGPRHPGDAARGDRPRGGHADRPQPCARLRTASQRRRHLWPRLRGPGGDDRSAGRRRLPGTPHLLPAGPGVLAGRRGGRRTPAGRGTARRVRRAGRLPAGRGRRGRGTGRRLRAAHHAGEQCRRRDRRDRHPQRGAERRSAVPGTDAGRASAGRGAGRGQRCHRHRPGRDGPAGALRGRGPGTGPGRHGAPGPVLPGRGAHPRACRGGAGRGRAGDRGGHRRARGPDPARRRLLLGAHDGGRPASGPCRRRRAEVRRCVGTAGVRLAGPVGHARNRGRGRGLRRPGHRAEVGGAGVARPCRRRTGRRVTGGRGRLRRGGARTRPVPDPAGGRRGRLDRDQLLRLRGRLAQTLGRDHGRRTADLPAMRRPDRRRPPGPARGRSGRGTAPSDLLALRRRTRRKPGLRRDGGGAAALRGATRNRVHARCRPHRARRPCRVRLRRCRGLQRTGGALQTRRHHRGRTAAR
ncbi:putative Osmosensitive K+ channel histidine kinase KdpD [Streptomyces misionensis JCM 4497]